jgi:hypothetical protein
MAAVSNLVVAAVAVAIAMFLAVVAAVWRLCDRHTTSSSSVSASACCQEHSVSIRNVFGMSQQQQRLTLALAAGLGARWQEGGRVVALALVGVRVVAAHILHQRCPHISVDCARLLSV